MSVRKITPPLFALLVLGVAGQALALDAWRDRRGLLLGIGIGGGVGQSNADRAESHVGFNYSARVGGGVTQNLTLDGEYRGHYEFYDVGDVDVTHGIHMGVVGANLFVFEGLYIRGMGGLAYSSLETSTGADDSETGLTLGAGAGYEFFANSDLAVGVGGDFQYLFFDRADFTLINFGITATWY